MSVDARTSPLGGAKVTDTRKKKKEEQRVMDMRLEVAVLPVSDVDRAKDFYKAGSAQGLNLVVTDIDAARAEAIFSGQAEGERS